MAYTEKNLRAALIVVYPTAPTNDLTTLWGRHIGIRVTAGDTPLYDGDDLADEVRNYLDGLSDV